MQKRDHHYYVYIVCSRTRVLYCGMTNNIRRRMTEHLAGAHGFTAQYRCERLVMLERFQYVNNAINREKQIKRWTRAKKIALIEEKNPSWSDLSKPWR